MRPAVRLATAVSHAAHARAATARRYHKYNTKVRVDATWVLEATILSHGMAHLEFEG
jgi:hypothetical protein